PAGKSGEVGRGPLRPAAGAELIEALQRLNKHSPGRAPVTRAALDATAELQRAGVLERLGELDVRLERRLDRESGTSMVAAGGGDERSAAPRHRLAPRAFSDRRGEERLGHR